MNSNKEFDELARQKLAERSFPFEEGHWLATQQALQAEKGSSKRGFWLLGALALLLAGGAAWWWMQNDGVVENGGIAAAEVEQSSESIEAEDIKTALQYNTPIAQRSTGETARIPVSEQAGSPAVKNAESQQPQPVSQQAATPTQKARTSPELAQSGTRRSKPSNSEFASPTLVPTTGQVVLPSLGTVAPITADREAETLAEIPKTESPAIEEPTLSVPSGSSSRSDQLPVEQTPQAESLEVQGAEATVPAAAPTAQTVDAVAEDGSTASELLDPGTERASESDTEQPTDSAEATLPKPLQLPLVAQSSPWEIGVLGGIFSSTSNFKGANSGDWNADITRQRSASVGAELMHMGSNFGVGFGVQYGSYAERIAVGEVSNTQVDIDRFWYLQPVNTTILVISDTLFQGGAPYYVGESVTTTVNVLTQGFDTTTTITQLRAARELYNRVSYVEIPLLLDAHLVQGRWSLGLRGGPTLGLLAGRRGSLPNGSNDGYTEFNDQAFRELMVGYTARAYIRYRWNAAWSVGLEPAIRGQLMNSLADGPLERRSSAFGGMISLSYRLR